VPVGDASPHGLTPLDPPMRVAVVLIIVVGRLCQALIRLRRRAPPSPVVSRLLTAYTCPVCPVIFSCPVCLHGLKKLSRHVLGAPVRIVIIQEAQLPQRNSASAADVKGRGTRPPVHSPSSGYTYAYGRIRKPQRTYVKLPSVKRT